MNIIFAAPQHSLAILVYELLSVIIFCQHFLNQSAHREMSPSIEKWDFIFGSMRLNEYLPETGKFANLLYVSLQWPFVLKVFTGKLLNKFSFFLVLAVDKNKLRTNTSSVFTALILVCRSVGRSVGTETKFILGFSVPMAMCGDTMHSIWVTFHIL